MTGVAGAEELKGRTLDCMVLPTSKAFPKSRPHRLMSLALPIPNVELYFHVRNPMCRVALFETVRQATIRLRIDVLIVNNQIITK